MTVHVGPYEFDHVSYDNDGDVLYLRRGERQAAADAFGTPEVHAVDDPQRPSGPFARVRGTSPRFADNPLYRGERLELA
jgi:hypothetical protein